MRKIVNSLLRLFFSCFYKRKYLRGYFFDQKKIGWYWALKGLSNKFFDIHASKVPWPVNRNTIVSGSENISFDLSSMNVFQTPGCYWQAHNAHITIGANCFVAPNVGIITTNHSVENPSVSVLGKDIVLSDYCWIGMNAVILPGVVLGPHCTVAAGAVVTKSFEDGYCVLAGVPAKVIRTIDYCGKLDLH